MALQQLAEAVGARGVFLRDLREVQTAGEQLRVTPAVRRWLGALEVPLHNHYGPSETHVATAFVLDGDTEGWPALPPVGRPVASARCYVLDRALRPVPPGVPGELYLGGDCLGRGYLGRPDLTAERWVPDAFSGEAGVRLYRSGDRARWTAAGELEFLGRLDQQVKVRGYRIEPGEVEAVLETHPGVREAAVAVREDAPGERRLVAYVVAAVGDGGAPSAAELRGWLGERLPEYMVPSAFVALDSLPLTATGKLDRRSLPAPGGEARAARAEFVAPRTPAEEALAGIWAEVLGVERVGVQESFFELGGHSLIAARVVNRVRQDFGADLPLRALFETPTIAELVARFELVKQDAGGDGRIRRQSRERWAVPGGGGGAEGMG